MVYRVRKQLVEEGFEAVLSRKQRATPAVARIFDGEKEAKLIPWRAPNLPRGARAGPCGCWRPRSWNSTLSIAPVTARSDARSKKHSPAASPTAMGYPAEGQQRFRSGDGRRVGRLYTATRSRLPAGLSGRNLQATDCRNARTAPDASGAPGTVRLLSLIHI